MSAKKKLELTWIGKEERPRLEPRILIEQPEHSMPATDGSEDNILIHGDNLLALKALEARFAGKVKCVYIDPPYNTGSAFTHYEDGLEHSLWLSLIRDRLEVLRNLLASDGSIWVSIDDNECHYLKVLMDEVFGRANFVSNVIWQKKYAPANDALWLSDSHDHILVYAKEKAVWRPNKLPKTEKTDTAYKNPDSDPRGRWKSGDYTCNKTADERPNLYYAITHPVTGKEIWPKRTSVWRYSKDAHERNTKEGRVWWGRDGRNEVPAFKRFLSEVDQAAVPQSIWGWEEVGHNQDAKREQQALNPSNPFSTPKPERLVHRIVHLATKPGDLVLDSFSGSGTTGAVAHKMRRRWIMVELADHACTHVVPRLRKVVDGTDRGGVSDAVGWSGGGGFRFYKVGPSLLERDRWGNWIVSPTYNPAMLAEAVCRHMGFTYSPAQAPQEFWRHGHSTESDFIYVTTQAITHEVLAALSRDIGPDRHLLICCKAWSGKADAFPNLTLRKIPQAVLSNCEWGRDDYSFRLSNTPAAEESDEDSDAPGEVASGAKKRGRKPRAAAEATPDDLFAEPVEG